MKIGLYFGTFNPIHIGHLIIANHFVEYSDLDEVWLVVTPHNPHKKKKTLLEDYHRLQLVSIAVENYPKLQASNIEFQLPQPNYTAYTLAHIADIYPQHQFNLIMGQDNLKTFHKWKNFETILENHHIYVYPRILEGESENQLDKHAHVHKIDAPIVEVSSTKIRAGIRAKKNVRPLLPDAVWKYLDEMNFYKK